MIKYFQGGYDEAKKYSYGSNVKKFFVCPDCGRVRDKEKAISDLYRTRSIGCICSDSYSVPKKYIYCLLSQCGIDFEMEYKREWTNGRLYDFRIISNFGIIGKKIIIETDGDFHRKDNTLSGMTVKESNEIDNIKNNMAINNGYIVIRINYFSSNIRGFKEEILNSELGNYINLSLVDFDECLRFSTSNFYKEICLFYKNNNLDCKHIAKHFKISKTTVRNALSVGTENGWCEYNPKKSREIGLINSRKKIIENAIDIYVYDLNGNYIGKFDSAGTFDRLTIKNKNRYFAQGILRAIRNKTYIYKNLLFFNSGNITKEDVLKIVSSTKKMCVKINQYNLFGELIRTYDTASQASKETGINSSFIVSCCKRKKYYKSAGGYIWRYYHDSYDMESYVYKNINKIEI